MLNPQKLTIMQITTNIQDHTAKQEFISNCINPLVQEINDLIKADDSPLGDLSATLESVTFHYAEPELGTLILIFDLHDSFKTYQDICKEYDEQNKDIQTLNKAAKHSMDLAANEAQQCLYQLCNYYLDPAAADDHYYISGTSLIYIFSIEC